MEEVKKVSLLVNVELNSVSFVNLHEEVVGHQCFTFILFSLLSDLSLRQVFVGSHAFVTYAIELLGEHLVCFENCCQAREETRGISWVFVKLAANLVHLVALLFCVLLQIVDKVFNCVADAD